MSIAEPRDGTVVIVTYNSADHIVECLDALAGDRARWDVVVVDNGSVDDTPRIVAERFPWVCLERPMGNLGFAGGCNLGATHATGEYLIFLNPDVVVAPGALDALVSGARANGAAAAGARLVDDSGEYQHGFAVRRFPGFAYLALDLCLLNRVWRRNPVAERVACSGFDPDRSQAVEQPAGASLLVRREVFERLGGFDEQFHPLWFEDVDLCRRIRGSGHAIWYIAEARMRHAGGHSVESLDAAAAKAYWYANLMRYARKHLGPLSSAALRAFVVVGAAQRALLTYAGDGRGRHSAGAQLRVAGRALAHGDVKRWYAL